jgi:hypothetical protein
VGITALPSLGPALCVLALLYAINNLLIEPRIGVELWNYRLELQPLIVFVLSAVLLGSAFYVVGRVVKHET